MGIDVTGHNDLAGNVDDVVGVFRCDRLGDNGDFAVPYSNIEHPIDIVCGIDHTSVLQHLVELLRSSQVSLNPDRVPYADVTFAAILQRCEEVREPAAAVIER